MFSLSSELSSEKGPVGSLVVQEECSGWEGVISPLIISEGNEGVELYNVIGSGAHGVVWRAKSAKYEVDVVVKELRQCFDPDIVSEELSKKVQITRECMNREAAVLMSLNALVEKLRGKINNEILLTVFPELYAVVMDTNNDCQKIVMEYVEGDTLNKLVNDRYRFSVAESVYIAKYLAFAAHYMHEMGYVYRDWKFDNIIYDQGSSRVVLLDYGLVHHKVLSPKNCFGGNLSTIAPESWPAKGSDIDAYENNAGVASDLYGIACVFYRLLMNHHPYDNVPGFISDFKSSRDAHREKPPIPIVYRNRRNNKIPSFLSELVMELLKKDPVERLARIPSAKHLFGLLSKI